MFMQLRYLPNIITCIRSVLILPLLWVLLQQDYRSAFYLFCFAGLTDGLDGLLARLFNWTSKFGALMDPIADKVLLVSSFIALVYLQKIPFWFASVMIGRDLWIVLGASLYRYYIGSVTYRPIFISKLNTVLQLSLILLLLVDAGFFSLSPWIISSLFQLTFVTTVVSAFQYTWIWGRQALCNA